MTEWTRRTVTVAAGLAIGIGLSAWAALSTPFTTDADTVTAIGLALVATAVAARWRRPALLPSGAVAATDGAQPRPRWWPWLVLGVALVTWELVCLFLGPRVDHPTVSSLYDSATRWRAVKAACFFGWLCVGAALVRS